MSEEEKINGENNYSAIRLNRQKNNKNIDIRIILNNCFKSVLLKEVEILPGMIGEEKEDE